MRRCACCGAKVRMMCERQPDEVGRYFCGSRCRRRKCEGHVGSKRNGTPRPDFLLTGISGA